MDAGGRLLVPTVEGLTINEGGHFRTVGKGHGLQGPVYSVLRDREDSIWLGSPDAAWHGGEATGNGKASPPQAAWTAS